MEKVQIMVKLGVNIDHSATVRQARYRQTPRNSGIVIEPNVVEIALLAEEGGADSITAHLREDRRHMVDDDIFALKENIKTKLNLEMACAESVIKVALKVAPAYSCLVPENREEVTTEGGLDVRGNFSKVRDTVAALAEVGTLSSIFIDPDIRQIELAKEAGAKVIELHTGAYANAWGNEKLVEENLRRLKEALDFAGSIGLTVNAGHGINYINAAGLLKIGTFNELNIGHTIIARAIAVGMVRAVAEMKELLK